MTEEQLLEKFDGPRTFAVDPEADSNRAAPEIQTKIGMGHQVEEGESVASDAMVVIDDGGYHVAFRYGEHYDRYPQEDDREEAIEVAKAFAAKHNIPYEGIVEK